jgi:Tol biopolymer transport system component
LAIFVSSVNGGGLNQMTTPDRDVENIEPAWSPTGRQIAFASNQDQFLGMVQVRLTKALP